MLQTLQQKFGACTIMDVGWVYAVLQQIALPINEKIALAAVDPFAAVIPTWSAHLSGFD
jgi:hypothetical protein